MLKLDLKAGGDLERHLEAAANSLVKLLEEAVKTGTARIAVYPSLDSLIAGSLMARRLLSLGSRPGIVVSLRPPPVIKPTILLGFDNVSYGAGDLGSRALSITSGEVKGTAVMNLTMVSGEGSATAITYLLLRAAGERLGVVDVMLALSGMYSGRYIDKAGRARGLDKIAVELMIGESGGSLQVVTTLKAYKPHEYTICESLSITVNPYYPGLTGDVGGCRGALGPASDRIATSLDEEELARVASEVIELVSKASRREPSVEDYVGGVVVSRDPSAPIRDPREALDALTMSLEVRGSAEGILAPALDPENEYPIIEGLLEEYSPRLAGIVSQARVVRAKSPLNKMKIYLVKGLGRRDSPFLVWRALSSLGMVEDESVIAVDEGDYYRASAIQVDAAFGRGFSRRLVEARIARLEGVSLWISKPAGQI